MSVSDSHPSPAETTLSWAALFLSGLALLFFIFNLGLDRDIAKQQIEIDQRQTAIDDGTARVRISTKLCEALARIAVTYDDDGIRNLLRSEGAPNWQDAMTKSPKSPTLGPKTNKDLGMNWNAMKCSQPLSLLRGISSCLVALVVLLETGYQTVQHIKHSAALATAESNQDDAVRQSAYQKSDLESWWGQPSI